MLFIHHRQCVILMNISMLTGIVIKPCLLFHSVPQCLSQYQALSKCLEKYLLHELVGNSLANLSNINIYFNGVSFRSWNCLLKTSFPNHLNNWTHRNTYSISFVERIMPLQNLCLKVALVQPVIIIVNSYYVHDYYYGILMSIFDRGQPVISINQD